MDFTRLQTQGGGFEPLLSATTKSLGDKVEIRIRDDGTGIPEEVKKIFNPFFTIGIREALRSQKKQI